MKEYCIECAGIGSARELHETIAREMNFPVWYGHNLDALHDLLTSIGEETLLTFRDFSLLPSFGARFRLVLNECEEENPHLFINLL